MVFVNGTPVGARAVILSEAKNLLLHSCEKPPEVVPKAIVRARAARSQALHETIRQIREIRKIRSPLVLVALLSATFHAVSRRFDVQAVHGYRRLERRGQDDDR
jgi:hypothetical protein